MTKKILVLQQVPHEGPGTLFGAIRRAGANAEVVPAYLDGAAIPTGLAPYAGMVILGGPMSVNDIDSDPPRAAQLRLVEEALAQDFPTLGVCLGAQLIALAAGARVYRGDAPEIGWFTVNTSMESAADPLFSNLPSPLPVFQWHGEGFDLPEGAVHLASSPAFPHQAFRIGQNVYGLQFHVEMEAHMIKEWMAENADDLTHNAGKVDLADLARDSAARCGQVAEAGLPIVERWLALALGHAR
ncbi:MAG: type 1 glutamine amidotransferase [Nitrospirae bacterium]|nr:type 1 glutamine amidotransferase [Nitrospirota bacterium]